jgi:hypothetical protein
MEREKSNLWPATRRVGHIGKTMAFALTAAQDKKGFDAVLGGIPIVLEPDDDPRPVAQLGFQNVAGVDRFAVKMVSRSGELPVKFEGAHTLDHISLFGHNQLHGEEVRKAGKSLV